MKYSIYLMYSESENITKTGRGDLADRIEDAENIYPGIALVKDWDCKNREHSIIWEALINRHLLPFTNYLNAKEAYTNLPPDYAELVIERIKQWMLHNTKRIAPFYNNGQPINTRARKQICDMYIYDMFASLVISESGQL